MWLPLDMPRCGTRGTWGREDELWREEDSKYEDESGRCAGLKMWENVKMWRCENVRMRTWLVQMGRSEHANITSTAVMMIRWSVQTLLHKNTFETQTFSHQGVFIRTRFCTQTLFTISVAHRRSDKQARAHTQTCLHAHTLTNRFPHCTRKTLSQGPIVTPWNVTAPQFHCKNVRIHVFRWATSNSWKKTSSRKRKSRNQSANAIWEDASWVQICTMESPIAMRHICGTFQNLTSREISNLQIVPSVPSVNAS